MDKFKIILPISIILGCVILGGFYFASKLLTKTVIPLQPSKEVDYFNKKIECEKFRANVLNNINQFNLTQKPEFRDSNNSGEGAPEYNLYLESNELKEIFYSPLVNSCLYLESRKTLVKLGPTADPNKGKWSISYESYYLVDALTGREIDFNNGLNFFQTVNRSEQFNSEKDLHDILNKYR